MPNDGRFTMFIPVPGMRLRKLDSAIPPNPWFTADPRKVDNWTAVSEGDVLIVDGIDLDYDVTPLIKPVIGTNGIVDQTWLRKINNRRKITSRVVRLKSLRETEDRKQYYILPLHWCTTRHFEID